MRWRARRERNITYTHLSLEQRQQSTTNQRLAIQRGTKMVGVIATGWDICHPQERTEGVLVPVSPPSNNK